MTLTGKPIIETRSDEQPLLKPEPCWSYQDARLGSIYQMDERTGELSKRGRHFTMVVGLFPQPVNKATYEAIQKGMPHPKRLDLAFDYTRAKRFPLHRINQSGEFPQKELDLIRGHVEVNAPKCKALDELIDKGDTRDACIICMTGPSLNDAVDAVQGVDRDKCAVIALNSAALKVDADYYFALDRRVKPEWAEAAAKAGSTLVCHPMVPPATVDAFTDGRRYIFGMPGRHPLNEMVRAMYGSEHYGITELEMGANVGSSAVHFAYLMGYKHIIITGMDVVWDDNGSLHWSKDVNGIKYDTPEDIKSLDVNTPDGGKHNAKCRTEYLRAYLLLAGHAYWLLQAGVKVYNCTGRGLVWEHPEAFSNYAIEERMDLFGNYRALPPMPAYKLTDALDALNVR